MDDNFKNTILPVEFGFPSYAEEMARKIAKHDDEVIEKLLAMRGYDREFVVANFEDFFRNIQSHQEDMNSLDVITVTYKGKSLFEIYKRHDTICDHQEDGSCVFRYIAREQYYLIKHDGYNYYPVEVKLNID